MQARTATIAVVGAVLFSGVATAAGSAPAFAADDEFIETSTMFKEVPADVEITIPYKQEHYEATENKWRAPTLRKRDAAFNIIEVTTVNADGEVIKRDAAGNTIEVTTVNADGEAITVNADGEVTTVNTDGEVFKRDAAGNIIEVTTVNADGEFIKRDAAGNIIEGQVDDADGEAYTVEIQQSVAGQKTDKATAEMFNAKTANVSVSSADSYAPYNPPTPKELQSAFALNVTRGNVSRLLWVGRGEVTRPDNVTQWQWSVGGEAYKCGKRMGCDAAKAELKDETKIDPKSGAEVRIQSTVKTITGWRQAKYWSAALTNWMYIVNEPLRFGMWAQDSYGNDFECGSLAGSSGIIGVLG